ncbi:MAG: hypothetical protein SVK08_11960 [Halobacteriota archaeon]|nr:hypothetical protein [Halobacteriota archaeon]
MSKVGSDSFLQLNYEDGGSVPRSSSGIWQPESGRRVKAYARIHNTGDSGPVYLDVKVGSTVVLNRQLDVGAGAYGSAVSDPWMPTDSTMTYKFYGWR